MPAILKRTVESGVSVTQYDISVIPNDFNVVTINNLIESGGIAMPIFQRNYIWDKNRASKFIESLILGLPIPQIFLYQKERNQFLVIDGQQRLLTVYYFMKQRFPRKNKRAELRSVFDKHGNIPEDILSNDEYFQEFKLSFPKLENGAIHPLNKLKYQTLGNYKSNFEFMTMRCMTVRQNEPKDDDSSIFEIFNRLNSGGINLSGQEIRACLYYSPFYNMLYRINRNPIWRNIWGKPQEDDRSKDIEVLLRCFALLTNYQNYSGSVNSFMNKFSKHVMDYSEDRVIYYENLFLSYLEACSSLPAKIFSTKTGSFNGALFDSIFVALGEKAHQTHTLIELPITLKDIEQLKADPEFDEKITHSTGHSSSVLARINIAKRYLL